MPHRRQDPPRRPAAKKGSSRLLAAAGKEARPGAAAPLKAHDGGVHVFRSTKKQPAGSARSVFIGSRIREMRKAQSLTLQQLADRSGLSPAHLSQLERNQ